MKRKKLILWAVTLAALFLMLGAMIWQFCTPQNTGPIAIENTPVSTEQTTVSPGTIPPQASARTTEPIQTEANPSSTETPKPTGMEKPSPALFCTLTIQGSNIEVYDSVDEASLKKHPGWLSSSAYPGDDGMCVIYGHRNRRHFRVLENAKNGDEIIVTTSDGTAYVYTITTTTIYESTDELRLPIANGKTLVLVTCYPFRYSGHAPGKYIVTAKLL